MNSEDLKHRINNDPNFVNIKRFDYSIDKLLERYPEGAPTKIICQALQMTEIEVESLYEKVLEKLRSKLV